ncbi:MAG TPA: hypothetical protein VG938_02855 [Verrucomicrobiae bacterium]|nr:hypothetical protein [Verrucomicrobiae bacterium]
MKRGGKVEICVLMGLLLVTGASAMSEATSPYDGIVERNVFNLHAPPAKVDPESLIQHTPPPKVTFTGITTILGKKLAFLTIPGAKPGALPESMMLAEGQAQNEIEVKQIDEKAGVVKITNHGESQTLDFEHDGVKPSGLPAPTMMPPPAPPPPNVIRPLRSLPPRSSLTPEEQVALIEVQRMKYQQENNPISQILPPTEMTPEANGAAPQ